MDPIITADVSKSSQVGMANLINQAIQTPNQMFRQLLTSYLSVMTMFWANPTGLSPQEVSDGLFKASVNVQRLFQHAALAMGVLQSVVKLEGLTQQDLATIAGTALTMVNANAFFDSTQSPIPGGYSVTFNPDGSVTVNAPAA